jgi:RNA polymerase sigma-70 factor, ECF subfamily
MMADAWTQLYIDTHRPLLAYATRRACRTDAADAVAETYARALAGFDSYQADGPMICWLVGILRNVLREQARGRREEPAGVSFSGVTVDGDPLSTLLRSEEADEVRHALDRLPAEERRVVVLRVVEGRTSEDAGAITGRAPASVRMIQTRAVRKLRVLYAQAG